ncbi:hypothetical protein [Salinibacterium sp.]|uniref:hypothetical protein n=1 Tax=Salinibacterium sp. TaxID=1915057 RepID=UPI00286B0818|nr:hypothetical protein [Salinibacterium sp.]
MDELERRIRAANPGSIRRGDPLSARAERGLKEILADGPEETGLPVRQWRRPVFVSVAAAVLVFIMAVSVFLIAMPRAAMAAPPLLELTPVAGSVSSALERIIMNAQTAPASSSSASIASETWSADLTLDPAKSETFVQPREIVRTRSESLGGEIIITAGPIRWGSITTKEHPPAPGTELEHQVFEHGQFPLLFTQPPPSNPLEMKAYFARFLGTNATTTTGEYFRGISDLRNEWTLSGTQSAALLTFIQGLPDVELSGETLDRLGRPGLVLSTNSRTGGAFSDLLVVDQNTGVLLAAEQVYLGGLTDVHLKAPTVLDYIAWKESN